MKDSKLLKIVLIISGLIGAIVGLASLIIPVQFYALNQINLGGQINLLNEIRASGGSLFIIGILIISGAFVKRLTYTSIVLSTVMYLSYGISRILSMILDGMPVNDLIYVCIIEIVIGLICLYCLIKYKE